MKIEANQWYRTRSGEIAYVAAILPFEHAFPILGAMRNYARSWFTNGKYYKGQDHEFDLVEHLPDCDSFDWVPKPQYEIWDFYSMPIGVKVQNKTTGDVYMVFPTRNNVCVINGGSFTYEYLFEQYAQLDGTPCGKEV